MNKFNSTFEYKVIYIFRINDEQHKNILKIGDATVQTLLTKDLVEMDRDLLISAAKSRVNQYTTTAGIKYELLHVELAVDEKGEAFRDHNVHKVLKRSGIKQFFFDTENSQNEWFAADLETAIKAIKAVKSGRISLSGTEISNNKNPIILRPEQEEAVLKTIKQFKTGNKMLWNAKMRFGKTLTALEVAKRMNYAKTIVLTHRPVVSNGWFEDFNLIFSGNDKYLFGSKTKGESIANLIRSNKNFVYFASIQDLRGSTSVGGKFDKNDLIFNIDWDYVVIDEAHEGTKTEQGSTTIMALISSENKKQAKVLELSGTPFNLLSDYELEEIYTWDYVMEQEAKQNWIKNNFGDSNPYEELPEMNIFTYNLNEYFSKYEDVIDKAFNFREFFRTWTGDINIDGQEVSIDNIGEFVHKGDVQKFINLLVEENNDTNYPYSTKQYREFFRHALWMLPGVKEAKAMSKLLNFHPVFGSGIFNIINVAGAGDEEKPFRDSLETVRNGIGNNPSETYSITLSCGRLTTGVSVPEWTAVLMMSGTYNTSASSYLQTIFRVQTPAKIGGRIKEKCYVFDFAPDRTLKMIAEAGQLSARAGSVTPNSKMEKFLNFCPIVSVKGSSMIPYDVDSMLQQLKKAYADRVVRNGFDDRRIYNDNLLKLDGIELEEFEKLQKIIGASKQTKKVNEIDINQQGFSNEEYEKLEKLNKKPKRELTEDEIEFLEEQKKKKDQAQKAMSILRGISIRIPLLIYGADISIEEEINCENFVEIVDDKSWEEFMPKGVTKSMFLHFSKYYDKDIFVASGRQIRNTLKYADQLNPKERLKKISEIFATFRNPDKETVLTPWKTVNMHMGDTLGGFNFYDEDYLITLEEPRFIDNGSVTINTLKKQNPKIMELNSKTGLYPLYITYSLFKTKCDNMNIDEITNELQKKIWNEILDENLFVVCKTPMAVSITKRTLIGFNEEIINNIVLEEDIVSLIKDNEKYIELIQTGSYWKKGEIDKMKFDAIVGNPPYQEIISDNENSSLGKQLFPSFIMFAIKMRPNYVSLITPSRWFAGDAQDKSFLKLRDFIKNNNHISKIYNYPSCTDVFDNVVIKGGVSYFLFDREYNGNVDFFTVSSGKKIMQNRLLFEDGLDIILNNSMDYDILKKIKYRDDFVSFTTLTKGRNAFGIVGKQEVVEKISSKEKFEGAVKLQCKNEEIRWTNPKNVTKSLEVFEKYKVFISKSAGDPSKDLKVIGKPYFAEPFKCCTDSLIPIGKFDTLEEAQNLQRYMKTKFLRFMVSILKVSQNVYQNVYQFVPVQNFSDESDINWKSSFEELDQQLYKKYNLSDEEIQYINNKVVSAEY